MMRKIGEIRREIKADKHGRTWRQVAELWTRKTQYRITAGMVYRIAVEGYDPTGARLRHALGLPAYKLAACCPVCGEVHVRKGCPRAKQYHQLFDYPMELLLWKLTNREAME